MHKSNTNWEKIFDNDNENIKTIEKLPQVKNIRFIHNSIFILLQRSYYSSIFQRKKLELYSKSLEKDDKGTPQVVRFVSLEHF